MPAYRILALYQFVALPDHAALCERLRGLCEQAGLCGTLLLAAEGINGTVAGSESGTQALLDALAADGRFTALNLKQSWADSAPFHRLKVRSKAEIVTMGRPEVDPAALNGTRLNAEQWNALLDEPDVVLIDPRNDYEVAVGRFPGALDPGTRRFRDFPDFVARELDPQTQPRIAMYCTGGIRCEKASHYLLRQGFEEVYHLDGGILQYLEDVPAAQNRWQGECFVFDGRVSVDAQLRPGVYSQCHSCRHPLGPQDREHPDYSAGECCAHCVDRATPERRARLAERERQVRLAAERGEAHIGRKDR